MDILTKNNLDTQNFSLFIRDLSTELNSNLKHIIEDTVNDDKEITIIKKGHKGQKKSKKPVKKKADIIREQQNVIRQKKLIQNDNDKIKFMEQSIDLDNPFKNFNNLKTIEGITKYKCILLDNYWKHEEKNKFMKFIITLYFNLKDISDLGEYKELVLKIGLKLEKYEYKLYMMKELGYLLPPLNFWDNVEKRLDPWQKDVIKHVNMKESVLVRAPTSAGKTFIAMSTGILHKKIIYICPAKPVAYQVGSHFILMGYKVHYLVDDLCYNSVDKETNIFVGTPKCIEDNLPKIGNHFDYAVYDEIHNLDKEDDGHVYENLIKLLNCNFLALSATIGNIDYLKDIFQRINPDKNIHYIEYNKRFINHQRYIYQNNSLKKLHPLCSTEYKDLNENFITNSLSFTPNDCSTLWEYIEETIDDDLIDGLSPDEYFKEDRILTLNDCLDYEQMLKKFIINLNDKEEQEDLLEHFSEKINPSKDNNIVEFLRDCKDKDMLPMIVFNTSIETCKKIFYDIYENLHKTELEYYPHHYYVLEKKGELYDKYLEDRETFKSKIKISKTSTDARNDITEKMEKYDLRASEKYVNDVNTYFDHCQNIIKKSEVSDKLKKLQIRNLEKEMIKFNESPDFHKIDIFQKHEDFCFTMKEPMSGDTIRDIRREIMKTLGVKIPYEHPIFQMLKRGVGLYIESMPDEYKWILQKLMSKRDIGVIISDRTLCLGIDLPIRTSCLMTYGENNSFTNTDYLQMSGRAGRRGMDDRGNVIFYGDIDYLSMMKGVLPCLQGSNKCISDNYTLINKISKIDPKVVFMNFINESRNIVEYSNDFTDIKNHKLLYLLRNYDSFEFVKGIKKLERNMFDLTNDFDKEMLILDKISELIGIDSVKNEYKTNKIEENVETILPKFKELYEIIIHVYNNLNKDQQLLTRKCLKIVYEKVKGIIIKYNGF
jgi:ATP-dependent RNA helicase DDX60